MFKWFSSSESVRFGRELASFVLSELAVSSTKHQTKFAAKAEKTLARAEQRLREFQARERMNFYRKAKLANAFLWALRDGGCSEEYANQLTDWLTARM